MQADDRAHAHQALSFQPAPAAAPRAAAPAAQQPHAYNARGLYREVFGFAPYWEMSSSSGNLSGSPLSDLQYDKLSTVAYFGLTLNGTGTFDNDAGMTGWNSTALNQLVQNVHGAGGRVQLVVKQFDNGTICTIVSNTGIGQTAISNTIAAAIAKGVDGINVDFEGQETTCSGQSEQVWFTNWVASLHSQAQARGLQVTVDAYSGSASWNNGFMRIDTLAPYVDAFFIMAYDMNASTTYPNAPLTGPYTYTDTLSVDQFVTKSGSKAKVILGVPYYGYKYSTTGTGFHSAINTSASGCYATCSDSYADILVDFACAPQLQTNWDNPSATPWASWNSPATNDPCATPPGAAGHGSWRELYYDNAASLAFKYDLVNNRDIRGAGIWALGYDHGSGDLWTPLKWKFQCATGPAGPPGYSILTRAGGIYSFGTATYWGNLIDHHYPGSAIGLAYTSTGNGYWILTTSGALYSFGDAAYYGNLIDHGYPGVAASLAAAKDGKGYGILNTGGGLYTFGSQPYLGNLIDHCYPGPAVALSNTP
jgi:hypothetical protein